MKKTPLDWREKALSRIRALILRAHPDIVEQIKYRMPSNPTGIPVWYCDGMICTGETYKEHLRLTFSKAAALKKHDPKGLFNAHSAIIVRKDDTIDAAAFKKLIRAAVAINREGKTKTKSRAKATRARKR